MRKFGYARVSTSQQSLVAQKEALLKEGVKSGKKIGNIITKIEKKWIENDFKISKEEVRILIKK